MLRKRTVRTRQQQLGRVESLENRNLLAADLMMAGDSNFDGVFDSSDIVAVFQEGLFESGQAAEASQGDWNGDGLFDTADFVFAFQNSRYAQGDPTSLRAEDAEFDSDATTDETNDRAIDDTNEDMDEAEVCDHDVITSARGRGLAGRGRMRGASIDSVIEHLTDGIANEDLPGSLSAEDAQRIIDGLKSAVEAGDADALQALLGEVREARKSDRTESLAERQGARVQDQIDRLQAAIDSANDNEETTVLGLPIADVQEAVNSASTALEEGEVDAAQEILAGLRDTRKEARAIERLGAKIESLQVAVAEAEAAGETKVHGLAIADVTAIATAASDAFAAGEYDEAEAQLQSLSHARRDAAMVARLEAVMGRLEDALAAAAEAESDTIRGGLSVEDVQAAVDAAKAALEEGDADAAHQAIASLRGTAGRGPVDHAPGQGGHGVDNNGRGHGLTQGRGRR